MEPQFYELLQEKLGIAPGSLGKQYDPAAWSKDRNVLAEVFVSRTRGQWCDILEGTDLCFAPVLTTEEAAEHPHNRARGTFVGIAGLTLPAPAPRLSRTPATLQPNIADAGSGGAQALRDWGVDLE